MATDGTLAGEPITPLAGYRSSYASSTTRTANLPFFKARGGPAGIHIFNRLTGTNLLIDEVKVQPNLWSRAPRNVSIALTNVCDLHCSYCYAPKNRAELPLGLLRQWLSELDAEGCLGIGFGGGEPTLCSHLPELCGFITRSTGMAATFTTHGHRMDDQLADKLKGNVHFIRVSMDGVGLTYERMRGKPFSALIGRIATIRHVSRFGINYVVNNQTLVDLPEAIALAAGLGADEFLLLPEQPVNGKGGIDKHTNQLLQEWVRSNKSPIRLSVSEVAAAEFPTSQPLIMESALRAYAHIDAAGVMRRSSFDSIGIPVLSTGIIATIDSLERRLRSEAT